jgi:hypothetical protein
VAWRDEADVVLGQDGCRLLVRDGGQYLLDSLRYDRVEAGAHGNSVIRQVIRGPDDLGGLRRDGAILDHRGAISIKIGREIGLSIPSEESLPIAAGRTGGLARARAIAEEALRAYAEDWRGLNPEGMLVSSLQLALLV